MSRLPALLIAQLLVVPAVYGQATGGRSGPLPSPIRPVDYEFIAPAKEPRNAPDPTFDSIEMAAPTHWSPNATADAPSPPPMNLLPTSGLTPAFPPPHPILRPHPTGRDWVTMPTVVDGVPTSAGGRPVDPRWNGHGTDHRATETHPPPRPVMSAVRSMHHRVVPGHPSLPGAGVDPVWKTPYSYGYFGAKSRRHWSVHHGYRDRSTQWRYE